MGWPWKFMDTTKPERSARRDVIDAYAGYAQLLVLLPLLATLLFRLGVILFDRFKDRKGSYSAIPASPVLKGRRYSTSGGLASSRRRVQWWLGEEVHAFGRRWGTRDEWALGIVWGGALLFLSLHNTTPDYLHVTKRFGMIAASQLPFHYLLAMKKLNLFAIIFRSSHEQINKWHRMLGRIIYGLLFVHAVLYINFFVGKGIVPQKLTELKVILGILAFMGLTLLYLTSFPAVRHWSYRVFFMVHLIVALSLPLVLYFHARPARPYAIITIAVFCVDLTIRKAGITLRVQAKLESIPGTNLVKITTPLPYTWVNRFRDNPGAHVYLSLPDAIPPCFNPFTVANVDDETGDLTFVARQLDGPFTRTLKKMCRPPHMAGDDVGKAPLDVEGPYGASIRFPNLAGPDFDRILLIAGGVGATFALPIYRSIQHDNPHAKVELVWALRGAGEATWAMGEAGGESILNDDNVQIFLTGDMMDPMQPASASISPAATSEGSRSGAESTDDGEVEMSSMYRDRRRNRYTSHHNRKRPDLKKIVDDIFKQGSEERVAVIVCGPEDMARDVREHVGVWVAKGRSVWYHNEAFGW